MAVLKGKATKDVFAPHGCPDQALSATTNDGVEVFTYPDVQGQGQELVMRCRKWVVDETRVNAMKTGK